MMTVDELSSGLRALLDDRDRNAVLAAQVPALSVRVAEQDEQIEALLVKLAALQPRPEPNNPTATFADVTVGPGQRSVLVPITLSEPTNHTIVLKWSTLNGDGTWSAHYRAGGGYVIFQPGESRKSVPVTLLTDLAASQTVKVVITARPNVPSALVGGTGQAIIRGGGTATSPVPVVDAVALPARPTGKTLTWAVDFADPSFACSDTGLKADGTPCWQARPSHGMTQDGNKETGLYAPPDLFPSVTMTGLDANGKRFIQVERHPEGFLDASGKKIVRTWDQQPFVYSSAMLQGIRFPAVIKTGSYVEGRLRMDLNEGTWPGFWLMPTKGWPPEIDILEGFWSKGKALATILTMTLHYNTPAGKHGGYGTDVPIDVSVPGFDLRDWHVYGCRIDPDWITYYVDDVPVFRICNSPPADTLWYPLFDMTVGGQVGEPAADAPLPARMGLDWFKVWN